MISYLVGKPQLFGNEFIVLTGGVGYGVKVTNDIFSTATQAEEIALFIYTHVKEDALELFGFKTVTDKAVFKLLISVSGVGPTTALAILDKGTQAVVTAIQNADVSFFTNVKRVGKKAAQKIIIELKNKLGSTKELNLTPLTQHQSDITEALIGLGFSPDAIQEVISDESYEQLPIQTAVKRALKQLGKRLA